MNLQDFLTDQYEDSDINENKAHYLMLSNDIKSFKLNPSKYKIKQTVKLPPGSPIGCGY